MVEAIALVDPSLLAPLRARDLAVATEAVASPDKERFKPNSNRTERFIQGHVDQP
jgi:hypothetical protein